MTRQASILAVLLLIAGAAWAQPVLVRFEVENPRAFGYVIGDTVTRRVVAEVAKPYRLQEKLLPKPGRLGPWLELRGITVKGRSGFATNRYELDFTYQVFNSPESIRVLELPHIDLHFQGEDGMLAQQIPIWSFTVAPIMPGTVLMREGLGAMRPDVPPPLLAAAPYRMRLGLYAAGGAAILLYLVYAYVGLPFIARSNGPFARAYRELRRFARRGDADGFRAALRRMHRAFDETAGATVFGERLAQFVAEHPRYADLKDAAEQFFRLSRHEFFGEGASAPQVRSMQWLLAFCRDCRDRERGVA